LRFGFPVSIIFVGDMPKYQFNQKNELPVKAETLIDKPFFMTITNSSCEELVKIFGCLKKNRGFFFKHLLPVSVLFANEVCI
jgi:hypothetical protein